MPFIVLFNKADLVSQWEIDESTLVRVGFRVIRTSAKTGAEVDKAFDELARALIGA